MHRVQRKGRSHLDNSRDSDWSSRINLCALVSKPRSLLSGGGLFLGASSIRMDTRFMVDCIASYFDATIPGRGQIFVYAGHLMGAPLQVPD